MASPGAVILSHVPESSRAQLFSGLINALRLDDGPSVDFVASTVIESADIESHAELATFLRRAIEAGYERTAASVSLKHPEIAARLFAQSADILSRAKFDGQRDGLSAAALASHSRFCKAIISHLPGEASRSEALSASIELLADADQSVSAAARDLVFTALSSDDVESKHEQLYPLYPAIWTQVQHLTSLDFERTRHVLGYSLWLRWTLSVETSALGKYIDESYWNLLLRGLRRGDAEIRKICLNILKLSLASEAGGVPPQQRSQFERYATVFETIVLGRYINQIQECKDDLNDLASPTSLVSSKWLYTLLASALDSHMQDSNRRFIGDWLLSAEMHDAPELSKFLREDFLPWAAQGSLFVASLKHNEHGNAVCSHGDRLASYIASVLRRSNARDEIWAIVWSYVKSKKTFAYAKVWLLKALKDSGLYEVVDDRLSGTITSAEQSSTSDAPAEQILRGLPDAAREYTSKILAELGVNVTSAPTSSRRDALEQEAISKCLNIDSFLDSYTDSLEGLNDLWSDLDYLEFPKNLLFHIPGAILCPKLVEEALNDTDLANSIKDKVSALQKVAETKTYIIAPLAVAFRSAALRDDLTSLLLDPSDFIIQAINNPPEPTIDLMLEEATVHLFARYEDYFGERPSYGIATLLDFVSQLDDWSQLHYLIKDILRPWKEQKTPPPTVSSWKTTLQLQVLLLCLERYKPGSDVHELVMDLLHVLSIEPLPRYRYLLEWMVVRLIQRMEMEEVVLEHLASKDHHGNPKFLASLMKIGSIIACSSISEEGFAAKLATLYVPLAASSKVVIRHEAQWQVPILLEHARSKGWKSITDNTALMALDDYIRSLERFSEPPLERKIGRFDPETHNTMANLVEGAWFGLDSTEAPLTSQAEFLKLYARDRGLKTPSPCLPTGDPIPQPPSVSTPGVEIPTKPAPAPRTIDDVTALQTKGTAYLARTLSGPSASKARPHNLIVVGSLVDNPYNLGGLSRVSEIFGASALTLQNQNVIGNKDFTSVAVSSHLHFPIVQLSAAGVPAWLAERKSEGFVVVGIEQTDRSVLLGSEGAKLPEKCVLVVGSEKEGIPAVVLTECDVLVEIPQMGVTRSLNVQTAVAVVGFEYVRQWGKRR